VKGAFMTIDRPYGALCDFLHHRIGSTHVAHHVESSIPHYHALEATRALQKAFPQLYLYDDTPVWKALLRERRFTVHNLATLDAEAARRLAALRDAPDAAAWPRDPQTVSGQQGFLHRCAPIAVTRDGVVLRFSGGRAFGLQRPDQRSQDRMFVGIVQIQRAGAHAGSPRNGRRAQAVIAVLVEDLARSTQDGGLRIFRLGTGLAHSGL
jgi:hypothetical protein